MSYGRYSPPRRGYSPPRRGYSRSPPPRRGYSRSPPPRRGYSRSPPPRRYSPGPPSMPRGGAGYRRYPSPPPANRDKFAAYDRDKRNSTSIFVGNLPYNLRERELHDIFHRCGPIKLITVGINQRTGHSKGFAFIQFEHREAAEEAMRRYQDFPVEGRRLRLDWDIGLEKKMALRKPVRSYERPPSARGAHGGPPGAYSGRRYSRSPSPRRYSRSPPRESRHYEPSPPPARRPFSPIPPSEHENDHLREHHLRDRPPSLPRETNVENGSGGGDASNLKTSRKRSRSRSGSRDIEEPDLKKQKTGHAEDQSH